MSSHTSIRYNFRGGLAFLLVEIPLWIAATIIGTTSPSNALILFFVGGIFIAPLSLLIQKFVIRRQIETDNPLVTLSTLLALIIPLTYPLIYTILLLDSNLLLAALGVVVGAHYLPYYHIYKLRGYIVIAATLVAGNSLIGFAYPKNFALSGIYTTVCLILFALYLILATRSLPSSRPIL